MKKVMAELTLTVSRSGNMHGDMDIYIREVPAEFAYSLRRGDEVACLKSHEEGGEWSARLPVHEVWRYADGTVMVQLAMVLVDPDLEPVYRADSTYFRVWWSARDGDITPQLLDSGWIPWVAEDKS